MVLVLVLTASITAALSAALGSMRSLRNTIGTAEQAARRLDAVAEAMKTHYGANGGFPGQLSVLAGIGRVSNASLDDPYRTKVQLAYRILAVDPDVVIVYSAGPDQRDDNGAGDDVVRRLSGRALGSLFTHERLTVLQRVIEARALDALGVPPANDQARRDAINVYLVQLGPVSTSKWSADLALPGPVMTDGWGTLLRHEQSDSGPILRSAGPDRTFDTLDDVTMNL